MRAIFLILFQLSASAFLCPTVQDELTHENKSTVMIDDQGSMRIWNSEDRHDLTYCVSNSFKELKPLIIDALKIATDDWMESANVTFRYVPSADDSCDKRKGPTTRFRIAIAKTRRYPYAAQAFFPYDERKTVTFKKSYVEKSIEQLLRLVRHEFGHVLGLRHEHIRYENPMHEQCREDDLFTALTEYDPSSIMHYSHCGGTNGTLELSEQDKIGVGLLYPY